MYLVLYAVFGMLLILPTVFYFVLAKRHLASLDEA